MAKYPVKYISGSKRAELNIEDMPTPHLMNAWRKLGGALGIEGAVYTDEVLRCMDEELRSRGCTWDAAMERWVVPPNGHEYVIGGDPAEGPK